MVTSAKKTNLNLIVAIILCVIAAIALVSVGWVFVLKSSAEVNGLRTNVSNLKQEANALTDLALKFKKIESQKNIVYEAIPNQKDISTFMADFEELTKKDGLNITNAQVGNSLTKSNVNKSGEFSQTISKQEYYELPIKYEVAGSYKNFTQLIVDLNTLRRLNSVTDIVVNQDTSDRQLTDQVKATFVLTIYSKK